MIGVVEKPLGDGLGAFLVLCYRLSVTVILRLSSLFLTASCMVLAMVSGSAPLLVASVLTASVRAAIWVMSWLVLSCVVCVLCFCCFFVFSLRHHFFCVIL